MYVYMCVYVCMHRYVCMRDLYLARGEILTQIIELTSLQCCRIGTIALRKFTLIICLLYLV